MSVLQDKGISASAMIAALRDASVTHFVTVPDFVQLALHQAVERGEGGMSIVRACNEDQAVCTAAGLTIAGARPLIVVQNQGFYACVNSVRAVALDARVPSVFLIGQFGREHDNYGQPATSSRRRVVSLLDPVLDTLGVPFWSLERESDLEAVDAAFQAARAAGGPAALVIGRPVAWH
ncbi:Thiamine pyrophosphate enzyme, N-terminal TPP-binding domain-containing protein [Cupriavidus necator]|uniref:Thiamine pyrophosphate enzyme, N-terminal TPP-binding domain-containing protein n=1 Tax=Cupriavidus necator TaxID=106590 RepID=A0A1K0ILG3_CUPNE|nr:Thiamine pyrophosphate enzyme, N-terminal TPP-binding domain-containing protein [Cupriavidus necator]